MKLKKMPKYIALNLLMIGACLILGFLSFGGMYAVWPVYSIALISFGLSVFYEGEVYFQNIKSAFNKLFKSAHLKRRLAKDFLLKHFPDPNIEEIDPETGEAIKCPQFFIDYEQQLQRLDQFGNRRLKKGSEAAKQKRQIEKTLRDMEKWFAEELFAKDVNEDELTDYERELRIWLQKHEQAKELSLLDKRRRHFQIIGAFGILSGLFMGLGTTYLLAEAFSILPMLANLTAFWPIMIAPMAIIAGIAYGLLTYNAMTDMLLNNPLKKRFDKIREDFAEKPLSFKKVALAIVASILFVSAIVLTICTAGTWWTVAKQAHPVFTWIGKLPRIVMGVINPIITAISTITFNLENTSESLDLIDDIFKEHAEDEHGIEEKKEIQETPQNENLAQKYNPFRLIINLTITSLRGILFLGHLVGIGVTADRVPGIPQRVSASVGGFCEFFEDMHYFVHHHHHDEDQHDDWTEKREGILKNRFSPEHGHSHDLDLPTRVLKLIFSPIYALAVLWDVVASMWNVGTNKPSILGPKTENSLTWTKSWEKQNGIAPEVDFAVQPGGAEQTSTGWAANHAIYRIERFKKKELSGKWIGSSLAQKKIDALTNLQQQIGGCKSKEEIKALLESDDVKGDSAPFNQHRFFTQGKTNTQKFLEEDLPARIALGA